MTTLTTRVEAMLPGLRARADEGEELRRLPGATLDDAHAAGLFAAIVPTSLGGSGLGLRDLTDATRTLAHADPAAAWTLSFLALHGWLLAKLPCRDEVFADGPVALAPAPLAPTGKITPADGGYRLTGRWEWATGIAHADWVLVHGVQTEPTFSTRFLLLPRADVDVEDVWHTSGMRATGSNTVVVEDAFVPAGRTIDSQELRLSTTPIEGDGLAGIPMASVLGLVASAPAVGAAEAAVELFRERCAERVLAYSPGDKQAEQPAAQIRLATAQSDVRNVRAGWETAIANLTAAAGSVDEDLRVATRLAAAAAVRGSRQVISGIAEAAGASVYFSRSPLQRLQRDVEVLKGHVIFDWDRTAELAGRYALGFPLRPTDLV